MEKKQQQKKNKKTKKKKQKNNKKKQNKTKKKNNKKQNKNISSMYSCQLCKLETVSDIFYKTSHKCKASWSHKPYLCLTYFWSNGPLNIENYIVISVLNCLLCNLKTVWDTFLKLYVNVYHHNIMCRTQES